MKAATPSRTEPEARQLRPNSTVGASLSSERKGPNPQRGATQQKRLRLRLVWQASGRRAATEQPSAPLSHCTWDDLNDELLRSLAVP